MENIPENIKERIIRESVESTVGKGYQIVNLDNKPTIIVEVQDNNNILETIQRNFIRLRDTIIEEETGKHASDFNRSNVMFASSIEQNQLRIHW